MMDTCERCGCPLFTSMRHAEDGRWIAVCDNCGKVYPLTEMETADD